MKFHHPRCSCERTSCMLYARKGALCRAVLGCATVCYRVVTMQSSPHTDNWKYFHTANYMRHSTACSLPSHATEFVSANEVVHPLATVSTVPQAATMGGTVEVGSNIVLGGGEWGSFTIFMNGNLSCAARTEEQLSISYSTETGTVQYRATYCSGS